MISERDIAEKFSVVWKQHFPLLTANFIRVFNEAQVKKINNPIPIHEDVRYDLVSETAFNLAEIVSYGTKSTLEYLSEKKELEQLVEQTAKTIWKSGNYTTKELRISSIEEDEIGKICNNILDFAKSFQTGDIQFKPKLKGYGFIPDLTADLCIDDTLFEIKTVNRNFKSSDLKQLFIYLALKQVDREPMWKYAGLYNPRRGTYCKFNIKSLIFNLTGGKSPNEAFDDLLSSLVRDIEFDTRF